MREAVGEVQSHRAPRLEARAALRHGAAGGSCLRWRSGLDAAAFAAILNVPVATLAGLEGGASTPDGPLLRLLQILARIPTLLATLHAELPRA